MIVPIRQIRKVIQTGGLLLVALALALPASAIQHIGRHGSRRDAKHEVELLEEQWRSAQLMGDLAAMDRLMADDFVGISMAGQANTKSQQLDRFRRRNLVLTQIDLSDRKIKLVGEVAIVTSLAEVEGTNEGENMKGMYRYTRVYQHLPSGIWKTTNFEATRVPRNR